VKNIPIEYLLVSSFLFISIAMAITHPWGSVSCEDIPAKIKQLNIEIEQAALRFDWSTAASKVDEKDRLKEALRKCEEKQ